MKKFDYNKYVSEKTLLKESEEVHPSMAPASADRESFVLKNLSPDEQTQLKEYVSSLREIKKEIKNLLKKAKKPSANESGNWGGPRKDMVMDPNKA